MLPAEDKIEMAALIRDHEKRIKRLETLEHEAGAGDWVLIENKQLASDDVEIEFANIPQLYAHLCIIYSVSRDGAGVNTGSTIEMTFNDDEDNSYAFYNVSHSDTTPFTNESFAANHIPAGPAGGSPSNFGVGTIWIPDYRNTTKNKAIRGSSYVFFAGLGELPANQTVHQWGGQWQNTSVITSIRFQLTVGDMRAESRMSLYGIR